MLAICRYHRNSNGWNDIGYNALVDKYGTIYEGRAGGLDQAVIGAHAQGFNSQTAGIANIGDYSSVGASPEALSATATYIRWKLGVHGAAAVGTGHPHERRRLGEPLSRGHAGHARARDRPSGHRQDRLPRRRPLRPARRDPRPGRVGHPVRHLRRARDRRAGRPARGLRRARAGERDARGPGRQPARRAGRGGAGEQRQRLAHLAPGHDRRRRRLRDRPEAGEAHVRARPLPGQRRGARLRLPEAAAEPAPGAQLRPPAAARRCAAAA